MTNDQSNVAKRRPAWIKRIRVERLFGYLTYTIPDKDADFSRLMILYGDNGSGKTTLLTLLFCLLSPVRGRGEKSYIAKTPFRHLEVLFDDGTIVSATKEKEELVGSYSIRVIHPDGREDKFGLVSDAEGGIPKSDDVTGLMQRLSEIEVALYFLPDDRRVRRTFDIQDDTNESVRAPEERWLLGRDGRTFFNFIRGSTQKQASSSHHLDISPAIEAVSNLFRTHALQSSSTGEENATSIYLRVVEQLTALPGAPLGGSSALTVNDRIQTLAKKIEAFTRFGLITPFPADKFLGAFNRAHGDSKRTIGTVIEPYVDGIEARLAALDAIRALILRYVETTNEFLTSKSIGYFLQTGITIRGYEGVLDPSMLSSGEKQLILLLSNTILARDRASVIIIDEPELSLNVKWQRALIDALLRCSEGSNTQYILASHSIELITQHRSSAIRLVSKARPVRDA